MKTNRLVLVALCSVAAAVMAGCSGSNHSADTDAPVYLTVDITKGVADAPVNLGADVIIPSMSIKSFPKAPGANLSSQDDVVLDQWVVTFRRTDGGTATSPAWNNTYNVYVPNGGTATLENYRIMPVEYLSQPPLNQLFPENGGFDRETGKDNIRQELTISLYGKTIGGRKVSLTFPVTIRFYYGA
ncbi:MAG: hypothetical protein MUF10_12650 [Thermoanaerobaculaceae bacterium]|jgi:hypothetical protein|nr:hypothetical protein [Thermoanaerobaculaceae bacterium]